VREGEGTWGSEDSWMAFRLTGRGERIDKITTGGTHPELIPLSRKRESLRGRLNSSKTATKLDGQTVYTFLKPDKGKIGRSFPGGGKVDRYSHAGAKLGRQATKKGTGRGKKKHR